MVPALSFAGAVLLSELGAAELLLGVVVGAGFLLYPVVDLASRHLAHRQHRGRSQHA